MTRGFLNRRLRQLHLWLGVAIGVQLGLWLVSGLFMTLFPIEQVRGDHLRAETVSAPLDDLSVAFQPSVAIALMKYDAQSLLLKRLNGKLVWYATSENAAVLLDAETGVQISPLKEPAASSLATASYQGRGFLEQAIFYDEPPREYGRAGPVWRVDFTKPDPASVYVDATTGDVRAVRTGLWRVFDFMWGLHIMDWSTRENFNSWWIKMTASVAVLFFITGAGLVSLRVSAARKRRNKTTKGARS